MAVLKGTALPVLALLLLLVVVRQAASGPADDYRRLLARAYDVISDDEDLDRRTGDSGSGSGGGSTSGGSTSGGGGTVAPSDCNDPDLARLCASDICTHATCQEYPEATCRPMFCEDCDPAFFLYGNRIEDCTSRPPSCKGAWTLLGRHCYRIQNRYAMDQKDAQMYCTRQGSRLVTIQDFAEQALVNTLDLERTHNYWTGGVRQGRTWYWELPEGRSRVTYTKWARGEPNNSGYRGYPENAIVLKNSGSYWYWNDATNKMKLFPICEAPPEKVRTGCEAKPCMNGGICESLDQDRYRCQCTSLYTGRHCELRNTNDGWLSYHGHMYLINTDFALSYEDAKDYCAMHDALLVSLNDKAEDDFIASQLTARNLTWPTEVFFTGGYKYRSYVYKWVDGSNMVYKNWAPGEPNRAGGSVTPENYVQYKFVVERQKWMWNDVYEKWAGYAICEKDQYWLRQRGLENALDARENSIDKAGHQEARRKAEKRWNDIDNTREY